MRLKNYNEDLVLETVKIVLKDRKDIHPTRSFILDVAAYALNRIPPKYITSERGFTREFVHAGNGNGEEGEKLINVIELITLINRAVEVVARRRREQPAHARGAAAGRLLTRRGPPAPDVLLQHAPYLRPGGGRRRRQAHHLRRSDPLDQ